MEKYAGPGHWNDPDMLEVGNGGMSLNEYEAHFALWALLKAPLLIGCDLVNTKQETLDLLGNEEIIAVNQDRLGVQGARVWKNGDLEVWAGPLENNAVAAVLFNRGTETSNISLDFKVSGVKGKSANVRDLLAKKDLGVFQDKFDANVEGHSVVVVKVSIQKDNFLA